MNGLSEKNRLRRLKLLKKEKQSIERHLIPVFGYRQYKSITPAEWLEFFTEKQTNEGIYNRIEKLISCCSGAYGLAKFKKGILYNPLEGIRDHLAKGESKSMEHVKIHQLPELISLIRNTSSRPVAIGLELLIHMFPRPGELRQAKWEQFDFVEKVDDVIPVQYKGMKKRVVSRKSLMLSKLPIYIEDLCDEKILEPLIQYLNTSPSMTGATNKLPALEALLNLTKRTTIEIKTELGFA